MGKGTYINDSIHGLIFLTEMEKKILSSTGFNRLHDVYQNATVYLTFPSNRTKRFEHSIGTMSLCSEIFFNSILNADESIRNVFFDRAKIEIVKSISEVCANTVNIDTYLAGGKENSEAQGIPVIDYKESDYKLIPYNVQKEHMNIHYLLMQSIRIAALLHDIGHPPYSHTIENAMNGVFNKLSEKENLNTNESNYKKVLEKYCPKDDSEADFHEKMGQSISETVLKGIVTELKDCDLDSNQSDKTYDKNLNYLIIGDLVNKILADSDFFKDLHKIIDSPLDGDRLDYVTRDPLNSGLQKGSIDYKRIINEMKLIKKDESFLFLAPVKSVDAIEDFFDRRFDEYKNIIGHHRVRKMDYLLQNCIELLIESFFINNQSKEPVEDELKKLFEKNKIPKTEQEAFNNILLRENFQPAFNRKLPENISGLWTFLEANSEVKKESALAQWNDSWLMTLLKQIYYDRTKRAELQKPVIDMLTEIVTSEKRYHSIIKRSEHFKIIDTTFRKFLSQSGSQIDRILELLETKTIHHGDGGEDKDKKEIVADPSIEAIKYFLKISHIDFINTPFLLSNISAWYDFLGTTMSLEDIVIKHTENEDKDIFVVFNEIASKTSNSFMLYGHNNELTSFNTISGLQKSFEAKVKSLPMFYIFVYNGSDIINQQNSFLESLGEKIGKDLLDNIEDWIKNL
ncbi:HD domain-containing protein [Vagococcus sp. BWB3-3]|uniref:HD domain-containing protein n=1 Tax=Vagococcus allomyrinae TaxID=2794353 RepID=A0A940P798_9ENTE|nr:HD domain-containing protein [Vagococcus allomyrinae]MBP1042380.1 HD domain-containing protein [Vagococcus allomyrinae]